MAALRNHDSRSSTPKMTISLPLPQIPIREFDFSPAPPPTPVSKKVAALQAMPKDELPDLLTWTLEKRPFLGPHRPFNLEKHLYLKDIYQCTEREIVLMKSSQMGASEWLISYAAHACDQRVANVLYVFPTGEHVSDFSTARLGPAIEASEYFSKIIVDGNTSGGLRGSDKIALKRIRDRFWYFRGGKVQPDGKAPQLKSIDADILIFDEVDEIDPRAISIAEKRLGHADEGVGNVLYVSTPSYPGVGIDAEYEVSDQRHWFIRCHHCGERQYLEVEQVVTEWDQLGRPVMWHGIEEDRAWVACRRCGKELDRTGPGEWVAAFPNRKGRAGFHLTRLFSRFTPLVQVVKNLDTVDLDKLREAWNQDLGLPFTPKGGSITRQDLDNCVRQYGHGPDPHITCYMGVDVSPSVLHVVVRTMPEMVSGNSRQLYAGETTWEHLHNLYKIYRPKTVVIDALPETTKAREFQDSYPYNTVWLAYYPRLMTGSRKEENTVWNSEDRTVLLDRTRVLDEMYAGFYGQTSTLPASIINVEDYHKHLMTLIRITTEDASGQKVVRYTDNKKADHYAHAETYAMAAGKCPFMRGWVEGAGA